MLLLVHFTSLMDIRIPKRVIYFHFCSMTQINIFKLLTVLFIFKLYSKAVIQRSDCFNVSTKFPYSITVLLHGPWLLKNKQTNKYAFNLNSYFILFSSIRVLIVLAVSWQGQSGHCYFFFSNALYLPGLFIFGSQYCPSIRG